MLIPIEMRHYILYFLFVLLGLGAYSQDIPQIIRTDEKVVIDGKKFYMHQIEKGHTIYSIGKVYNVSNKELFIHNPVLHEGLKPGQVLKIPVRASVESEKQVRDTSNFLYLKVKKCHTLYSLSKKYDVSIDEIYSFNPKVETEGLKRKMEIRIPKHKMQKNHIRFVEEAAPRKDTLKYMYHKVQKGETVYSLSRRYKVEIEVLTKCNPELQVRKLRLGETIRIPKQEKLVQEEKEEISDSIAKDTRTKSAKPDTAKKMINLHFPLLQWPDDTIHAARPDSVKIALLLPFNASRNLKHIRDLQKRDKEPMLHKGSSAMVQFYQAFLLALDSIVGEEQHINLQVVDTYQQSDSLQKAIDQGLLEGSDMIIGPVYSYNIKLTLEYAHSRDIPVFASVTDADTALCAYSNLVRLTPSVPIKYRFLARFAIDSARHHVVVIHDGSVGGKQHAALAQESFKKRYKEAGLSDSLLIRSHVFEAGKPEKLKDVLSKKKNNLVILGSTDRVFVSSCIAALYQCDECNIRLIGDKRIMNYENIENDYFHSLNFAYPSASFVDYTDSTQFAFIESFRDIYYDEPDYYAFLAYDIAHIFVSALFENGEKFLEHVSEKGFLKGNALRVDMLHPSYKHGYINLALILVSLQEDYSIRPVYFSH